MADIRVAIALYVVFSPRHSVPPLCHDEVAAVHVATAGADSLRYGAPIGPSTACFRCLYARGASMTSSHCFRWSHFPHDSALRSITDMTTEGQHRDCHVVFSTGLLSIRSRTVCFHVGLFYTADARTCSGNSEFSPFRSRLLLIEIFSLCMCCVTVLLFVWWIKDIQKDPSDVAFCQTISNLFVISNHARHSASATADVLWSQLHGSWLI